MVLFLAAVVLIVAVMTPLALPLARIARDAVRPAGPPAAVSEVDVERSVSDRLYGERHHVEAAPLRRAA